MSEYFGEERRRDYRGMAEDLHELKALVENLREEVNKIAVIEERINNWMESTTDYRKLLCDKIEEVKKIVDSKDSIYSGCMKKRIETTNSIFWLWGIISIVTLGLLWIVIKG
ncbi:MAG: hypothetical protein QME16_00045 [Planctomycetota bacterium]|nr:hypothetical protein [Planctomycetota bacterium]